MALATNPLEIRGRRPRLAVLPFLRGRSGNLALLLPLTVFVLMALACFFAPGLASLPPSSGSNLLEANLGLFSHGHLLGTDALGNDLLSRSLVGGRVSIVIGIGATAAGFLVGSNLGMIAGYFGGRVDTLIMRLIDVQLAFPGLILALAISEYLGAGEFNEWIALSFLSIPNYTRLSRAATLRIREREFVVATRIMGGARRHIVLRHIYPNIVPALITIFPITMAVVMIIESALSFLGAGIRPPQPSWGNMISQGLQYINTTPIDVIVPAAFLFVTVYALNLIGEQLRLRYGR